MAWQPQPGVLTARATLPTFLTGGKATSAYCWCSWRTPGIGYVVDVAILVHASCFPRRWSVVLPLLGARFLGGAPPSPRSWSAAPAALGIATPVAVFRPSWWECNLRAGASILAYATHHGLSRSHAYVSPIGFVESVWKLTMFSCRLEWYPVVSDASLVLNC